MSILFTEKSPATKTILTHINTTFLPLISAYRLSSFRIKDLKIAVTDIITKKEIELNNATDQLDLRYQRNTTRNRTQSSPKARVEHSPQVRVERSPQVHVEHSPQVHTEHSPQVHTEHFPG